MKEATGELSTTVIAIVAIAAILTIFTVFLLPTLRAQIALSQACANGPGYNTTTNGGTITCTGAANAREWQCTYQGNGNNNGRGTKQCTRGE